MRHFLEMRFISKKCRKAWRRLNKVEKSHKTNVLDMKMCPDFRKLSAQKLLNSALNDRITLLESFKQTQATKQLSVASETF